MNVKIEQWMNWILYDELMEGKINAPKHLLGNHDYGEGQMITAYKPHSVSIHFDVVGSYLHQSWHADNKRSN